MQETVVPCWLWHDDQYCVKPPGRHDRCTAQPRATDSAGECPPAGPPARTRNARRDHTRSAAPRPGRDRRAPTDAVGTKDCVRPRSVVPVRRAWNGAPLGPVATGRLREVLAASMANPASRCVMSSCSSRASQRRSSSCALIRRPLKASASPSARRRRIRCHRRPINNAVCNRKIEIAVRIKARCSCQNDGGWNRISLPGGRRARSIPQRFSSRQS